MTALKGLAHMSIPVSDLERSIRFYCDVVGCTLLQSLPRPGMAFLDAGGDCVVLVKQAEPINPKNDDDTRFHHAFRVDGKDYAEAISHLQANGVRVILEENREDGIVNGQRAYFHDPDRTVLEYIDLTYYVGDKLRN